MCPCYVYFLQMITAFMLVLVPTTLQASEPEFADLILHNGKIVTVDQQFSIAQAIAIRGQKILRVGSEEEVLSAKGPETQLVDLHGKMVMPGLMDSHVHPNSASMHEFDHKMPHMKSIADVLR